MTKEALKEEIRNLIAEWKITPENKRGFRGQAIALLGMKYETRPQNDEEIFGEFVDEAIEEKLRESEKNVSMEDAVRSGIPAINVSDIADMERAEKGLEPDKEGVRDE